METCEWHLDDEDANNWVSECGHSFWFEEGDPKENEMKFCPYCGRNLTQRAPDLADTCPVCGFPRPGNYCENCEASNPAKRVTQTVSLPSEVK